GRGAMVNRSTWPVTTTSAESPGAVFNLCVAEDTNYKEVEVSVAFKAIRGQKDQDGGMVWRYQDPNHYYIARMNPLEDNYRVYKFGPRRMPRHILMSSRSRASKPAKVVAP